MTLINIIIDNQPIILPAGTTILAGARIAKKYIPTICSHPTLPPAYFKKPVDSIHQYKIKIKNNFPSKKSHQCGICIVEVERNKKKKLVYSCITEAKQDMIVWTNNEKIRKKRQNNILPILSNHKHACITCSQQEGCSQSQCSSNVQETERCCPIFNKCEFKNTVNYVKAPQNTPKWIPTNFPIIDENPLIKIDYNLCIGCTRCVRVCNEIRKVGVINFVWDKKEKIKIGTINQSSFDSECKFCISCIEICPTGCLQNKTTQTVNKKNTVSCKTSCPMNINIPNFLRMISIKKFDKAIEILNEKIPFPKILGRICMHPCENECRRKKLNYSIAICSLKKFVSNIEQGKISQENKTNINKTHKKISIIGAGPAGLSAAYFLKKKGHYVTLYDSQKHPGGMLRYAIPKFRLPLNILENEINNILKLGINFIGKKKLGINLRIEDLLAQTDAVLLSIGAQNDRKIEIKGVKSSDLTGAINFLKSIENNKKIKIENKIIIIGGGNVAIDVAMTAIRKGSKKVSIVCLENENEMPANKWEIERAKSEGISIYTSWGPYKINKKNGIISNISLIKCKSVFNTAGIFNPKYDYNIKKTIPTDQVILAVGQEINTNLIKENNISIKNGFINVNKNSFKTNINNVYATGDAISLPGSVIKAIDLGQKAAESINFALGFKNYKHGLYDKKLYSGERINKNKTFTKSNREIEPRTTNKIRKNNFQEIIGIFTKEQAIQESKRCLQCDLSSSLLLNQNSPQKSLKLNRKNIYEFIPNETEGVYKLLNKNKKVLSIIGTKTIQKELLSSLKEKKGEYFEFEKDKMYSKRESELIQKYLQKYGEMPEGTDDSIDDLF